MEDKSSCLMPSGVRWQPIRTCVRSMPPGSPGNFSAATTPSRTNAGASNEPHSGVLSVPTNWTVSRGAGGCDFVIPEPSRAIRSALWTAASLPSVIPITPLPADLADPNLQADALSLGPALDEDGPERLIDRRGCLFRLHILATPGEQIPCVVLPLDRVFEIRAAAALRLWRGLTGRLPGRDPAILPGARRNRLLLALRALDGRIEKASYRDIAETLFGDVPIARLLDAAVERAQGERQAITSSGWQDRWIAPRQPPR